MTQQAGGMRRSAIGSCLHQTYLDDTGLHRQISLFILAMVDWPRLFHSIRCENGPKQS